jgi:DNA-directed RNA polymerase specialized sigma24 family protein
MLKTARAPYHLGERAGRSRRRWLRRPASLSTTYVDERGDSARWLFTVAQNAIVDHASPEPVADDGWPAFRVHAAVADLPGREGVPLELADREGRGRSEIAELLGLPLGTVETRTRSALARLAVRLEGLG